MRRREERKITQQMMPQHLSWKGRRVTNVRRQLSGDSFASISFLPFLRLSLFPFSVRSAIKRNFFLYLREEELDRA